MVEGSSETIRTPDPRRDPGGSAEPILSASRVHGHRLRDGGCGAGLAHRGARKTLKTSLPWRTKNAFMIIVDSLGRPGDLEAPTLGAELGPDLLERDLRVGAQGAVGGGALLRVGRARRCTYSWAAVTDGNRHHR